MGFKEETSFFISNLPFKASNLEINRELERYGTLVDLFVYRRRDKHDHRFGFVRFNRVENVSKLEVSLNEMFIRGRKLFAKVARFDRDENKGLAKAGKGVMCRVHNTTMDNGIRSQDVYSTDLVRREMSSKSVSVKVVDDGSPRKKGTSVKTVKLSMVDVKDGIDALQSRLVGEVKRFTNLLCISNICTSDGLRGGIVKYLGGL